MVTAFVEHLRREHERLFPIDPLKIFFDVWGIRDGDDWERRIYKGLKQSKVMLAVLSPAYFNSPWCRREFDEFATLQFKKLYPGETLSSIYIHEDPRFESQTDDARQSWFEQLKRWQFVDAKPWWPEGQSALERETIRQRLDQLRETLWEKVCEARQLARTPSNLTGFNPNFVGREAEIQQMWHTLDMSSAVALAAVQGIGGQGKTALARAYAHARWREYPGGMFEVPMENVDSADGIRFKIVELANQYLGAAIPEEKINTDLAGAFEMAKVVFERQGRSLLILDNVATDGLVTQNSKCFPSPRSTHVLVTTRLDPETWGLQTLRLESLSTEDALKLFTKYRPFDRPDDETWGRVIADTDNLSEDLVNDEEWKAAVKIVNRLGRHALAVEVVAVFLSHNRSIRLVDYLDGLEKKGLSIKLTQAGDSPKVRGTFGSDTDPQHAIETNIARLLEPTFERLERDCPLAMRALEWAALLPPDNVPLIWLKELIETNGTTLFHQPDESSPWDDVVIPNLIGWTLVKLDDSRRRVSIHRIVQAAIQARFDTSDHGHKLGQFISSKASVISDNFGAPEHDWQYRPLIESIRLLLARKKSSACEGLLDISSVMRWRGEVLDNLKLLTTALSLDDDHAIGTLRNYQWEYWKGMLMIELAESNMAAGENVKTHELSESAIGYSKQLRKRSFWSQDFKQLHGRSLLLAGNIALLRGDFRKARVSLFAACDLGRELGRANPKDTQVTLLNIDIAISIGNCFLALAEPSAAISFYYPSSNLFKRLLRGFLGGHAERLSPNERASIISDSVFVSCGKNENEALEWFKRALHLAAVIDDQEVTLTLFGRLVSAYFGCGDVEESKRNLEEALNHYDKSVELIKTTLLRVPRNEEVAFYFCEASLRLFHILQGFEQRVRHNSLEYEIENIRHRATSIFFDLQPFVATIEKNASENIRYARLFSEILEIEADYCEDASRETNLNVRAAEYRASVYSKSGMFKDFKSMIWNAVYSSRAAKKANDFRLALRLLEDAKAKCNVSTDGEFDASELCKLLLLVNSELYSLFVTMGDWDRREELRDVCDALQEQRDVFEDKRYLEMGQPSTMRSALPYFAHTFFPWLYEPMTWWALSILALLVTMLAWLLWH